MINPFVSVLIFFLFSFTAFAQDICTNPSNSGSSVSSLGDVSASLCTEAQKYLNELAKKLNGAKDDRERKKIFNEAIPTLKKYFKDVKGLELATAIHQMRYNTEEGSRVLLATSNYLRNLADTNYGNGKLSTETAHMFVSNGISAAFTDARSSKAKQSDMKKLADAVKKYTSNNSSFISYLTANKPHLSAFTEGLIKCSDVTSTCMELMKDGTPNVDSAMSLISNLPPTISGGLSTSAGVVFGDVMKYTTGLVGDSTEMINTVADAQKKGKLDKDRVKKNNDKILARTKNGPWSTKTAKDFSEKIIEGIPIVGDVFKSVRGVWDDPVCNPINCDCESLKDWGLLAGQFTKECRLVERSLKLKCNETRKIVGTCHQTAAGPKAFPKHN